MLYLAWLQHELISGLCQIRAHAEEMRGKTAMIYDKSSPIIAMADELLRRLGASPVRSRDIQTHTVTGWEAAALREDIGQGEGCEGGKCDPAWPAKGPLLFLGESDPYGNTVHPSAVEWDAEDQC